MTEEQTYQLALKLSKEGRLPSAAYSAELVELSDEGARSLVAAVRAMHEAERAYGCGFYGQDDWREAYDLTAKLIGLQDGSE